MIASPSGGGGTRMRDGKGHRQIKIGTPNWVFRGGELCRNNRKTYKPVGDSRIVRRGLHLIRLTFVRHLPPLGKANARHIVISNALINQNLNAKLGVVGVLANTKNNLANL